MIGNYLDAAGIKVPTHIIPIRDFLYSDLDWLAQVQRVVNSYNPTEVTLHGTNRDPSTYYLKLFPDWKSEVVYWSDKCPGNSGSATRVRQKLFTLDDTWVQNIPPTVQLYIEDWIHTPEGKRIQAEWNFIETYKAATQIGKYPIIFSTVDAVVVHKLSRVLLVKRGAHPGKGLWALPGGFLNDSETLLNSSIREVREETGLIVNSDWKRSSKVFDAPKRSQRGRTITTAFLFQVPDVVPIGDIVGRSDASTAQWIPIGDILPGFESKMFEDHIDIISTMIKDL
jgi:bifunctional NMN adenylyltransferase/nudix hydrolase